MRSGLVFAPVEIGWYISNNSHRRWRLARQGSTVVWASEVAILEPATLLQRRSANLRALLAARQKRALGDTTAHVPGSGFPLYLNLLVYTYMNLPRVFDPNTCRRRGVISVKQGVEPGSLRI